MFQNEEFFIDTYIIIIKISGFFKFKTTYNLRKFFFKTKYFLEKTKISLFFNFFHFII